MDKKAALWIIIGLIIAAIGIIICYIRFKQPTTAQTPLPGPGNNNPTSINFSATASPNTGTPIINQPTISSTDNLYTY